VALAPSRSSHTDESWEFAFAIERGHSKQPLFLQIARTLVDDICRGRLKPGDRLPGTRTLARSLGVNRITVLTAYDELAAEGWITVRPASGARVSDDLPERLPRQTRGPAPRTTAPLAAGYDLPSAPFVEYAPESPANGQLVFSSSAPDTRLLPIEPLARAYRRVLRRSGGQALSYGSAYGHDRLRAALASMLSTTRGLACAADQVFITRGSQMALSLVARALARPGDVIAVENFGYRHAWEAFRQTGATLVPVPVDADGLDVGAFERLLATTRIRAVYVTPHHQFPTLVALSAERRVRLLELARTHRIAIIEDDYDHEFHYDGRPVLPLASLDRAGQVIYVGTLSKVLAPGLRIGYVVGPADLLQRIEAHRKFIDIQGDHTVEAAVAELVDEGEVQRHVRRVRRHYQRRRDLLADLLQTSLGGVVTFAVPAGGIALWARVASGIDVDAWAARAAAGGIFFQTGRWFAFDRRPRPFARLGFASLNEAELRVAVDRLTRALR
jgi:GntR family transcriptional regulator/MocR family aminotransferase